MEVLVEPEQIERSVVDAERPVRQEAGVIGEEAVLASIPRE
jgi:hypothetical protein